MQTSWRGSPSPQAGVPAHSGTRGGRSIVVNLWGLAGWATGRTTRLAPVAGQRSVHLVKRRLCKSFGVAVVLDEVGRQGVA